MKQGIELYTYVSANKDLRNVAEFLSKYQIKSFNCGWPDYDFKDKVADSSERLFDHSKIIKLKDGSYLWFETPYGLRLESRRNQVEPAYLSAGFTILPNFYIDGEITFYKDGIRAREFKHIFKHIANHSRKLNDEWLKKSGGAQ